MQDRHDLASADAKDASSNEPKRKRWSAPRLILSNIESTEGGGSAIPELSAGLLS